MTTHDRRAEARIDLAALAHNVIYLKQKAGVDVLAVVKGDAYGHGLVPIAEAAIHGGASWLGVALLEEALALREAGITSPILAWLVPPGSDYRGAIENNIDLGVSSLASYHQICRAALGLQNRVRIHIEVDTGMTRGGFLDEWPEFLKSDFTKVDVIGIFSHFARADEPEEKQNTDQHNRFVDMVAELESVGVVPAIMHLSNSAATLSDPGSHFDLVRSGIAMYGLSPDVKTLGDSQHLSLKPVMQLRAKLHLVKRVEAGASVGYGASAKTTRATNLGIVAMGYADGIPRIAQSVGVFIDGERAPIIGRVSMDQFVVDLGPLASAQSGDWVIVFGDGSRGEFTADDWGSAASSINYEIVTRIGPRVPRIYEPHVY